MEGRDYRVLILEVGVSLALGGYAHVADSTHRRGQLREVKEACLAGLEEGRKGKRLIDGMSGSLETQPVGSSRH